MSLDHSITIQGAAFINKEVSCKGAKEGELRAASPCDPPVHHKLSARISARLIRFGAIKNLQCWPDFARPWCRWLRLETR